MAETYYGIPWAGERYALAEIDRKNDEHRRVARAEAKAKQARLNAARESWRPECPKCGDNSRVIHEEALSRIHHRRVFFCTGCNTMLAKK